jgi:hypothetical protein
MEYFYSVTITTAGAVTKFLQLLYLLDEKQ